MKTLLIKNASHISTMDDNNTELKNKSIFCRSGIIEKIGDFNESEENIDLIIDAKDLIVIPGLLTLIIIYFRT